MTAARPEARPENPAPVLKVRDLHVTYGSASGLFWKRKHPAATVAGVSFDILPGQTLGLVGESGSGKSTTGKAVLGLIPSAGKVEIDGRDIVRPRPPGHAAGAAFGTNDLPGSLCVA